MIQIVVRQIAQFPSSLVWSSDWKWASIGPVLRPMCPQDPQTPTPACTLTFSPLTTCYTHGTAQKMAMPYRKGQLLSRAGLECREVSLNWVKKNEAHICKESLSREWEKWTKFTYSRRSGPNPSVARLGTSTTFLLWCLQTHGCANVEQIHDIFPRIWIILSFKYQKESYEPSNWRLRRLDWVWLIHLLPLGCAHPEETKVGHLGKQHRAMASLPSWTSVAAAIVAGMKQNKMSWLL